MWGSEPTKVVIGIKRVSQGNLDLENQPWPLEIVIYIGEELIHKDEVRVQDPFQSSDYEDVAKYLDRTLDLEISHRSERTSKATWGKIDKYRRILFGSLNLNEFLERFVGCKVEVQISEVATLNILLVVARKHLYDNIKVDYFNPTSVQRALLEAQEELESSGSQQCINIEVVRPGSLQELKSHLERHSKLGQEHAFQVVHFDMHGGVSLAEGAYLEFNELDESNQMLITTKVGAADIAEVLLSNNIDCAVLSACKSAKADSSIHANLSLSFLNSGLSCVLGASYNMPDSMSKIFYSKFYHEMLIEREEFAEAATKARYELRLNPLRWSYCNKKDLTLQDWFIPVVYSDGTDHYIDQPLDARSKNLRLLRSLLSWIWWALLSLSTVMGILHTIPTMNFLMESILRPFAHIIDASSQRKLQQDYFTTCCYFLLPYFLNKTMKPLRHWKRWAFRRRLETLEQDRKNILRIEGDLRRSQKIFIHTLDDVEHTASQLLDTLTDIWRRTHLVEHRVIIQAEWFIQHFQPESPDEYGFIDWTASFKSLGRMFMLWRGSLSPGLRQLASSVTNNRTKTVVVINNVNKLYPERLLLKDYHIQAQQRFADWVERHFQSAEVAEESTDEAITWYLVLLGQGTKHNTKDWFNLTLGNCTALRSTAMTKYTNPREFIYNRENSSPTRSWL